MNYRDYIPFFIKQLLIKRRIKKIYGDGNVLYTNMIGKNVTLGDERGGCICLIMLMSGMT